MNSIWLIAGSLRYHVRKVANGSTETMRIKAAMNAEQETRRLVALLWELPGA